MKVLRGSRFGPEVHPTTMSDIEVGPWYNISNMQFFSKALGWAWSHSVLLGNDILCTI
jgi:hypothetical protein